MNYKELIQAAKLKFSHQNFAEAEKYFSQAIKKSKSKVESLHGRAKCRWQLNDRNGAFSDLSKAFHLAPNNKELIEDYVGSLVQDQKELQALEVCNIALKKNPDNVTARIGRDWVLSNIAPIWHIPMINEYDRNNAYYEGIKAAAIGSQHLVLEIGTGSGLLAMFAASAGAEKVITCEAKETVAKIAEKVISNNRLSEKITVINKTSDQLRLDTDLPCKADILIHEIFSSELLSEHVLPAIEDARSRLLNPQAKIIPGKATVMLALVGGKSIENYAFAGQAFGFDLGEFNRVQPYKIPLYRQDLRPELYSDDFEAFVFDFQQTAKFPAETKIVQITANRPGKCVGLIQWIKLEFEGSVLFQNHPAETRQVSNWQHILYKFDQPLQLETGQKLSIRCIHDRARLWFEPVDAR